MKPTTKRVKKKPALLLLEKANAKPRKEKDYDCQLFSDIWPEILKYMIANKDSLSYIKLWKKYRGRIADVYTFKAFCKRLENTGMQISSIKKATSVKQQVQIAIKNFADVKKEHAEQHMQKIHKKLGEIHKVVDEMKVTDKNVSFSLDLVSRLHKEGRLAYGIDDDSAPDKKVTNLAVMIGWNPTEKPAQVKVIE